MTRFAPTAAYRGHEPLAGLPAQPVDRGAGRALDVRATSPRGTCGSSGAESTARLAKLLASPGLIAAHGRARAHVPGRDDVHDLGIHSIAARASPTANDRTSRSSSRCAARAGWSTRCSFAWTRTRSTGTGRRRSRFANRFETLAHLLEPVSRDRSRMSPAAEGALGDRAVRRVGLGGGRIPGFADDSCGGVLLRRALELGVHLIDTADITATGLSEMRIADGAASIPEDLVIATKGGFVRAGAVRCPTGGPQHLRAACEAACGGCAWTRSSSTSSTRPTPRCRFEESLGALVELRETGKGAPPRAVECHSRAARARAHADTDRLGPERLQRQAHAGASVPIRCSQRMRACRHRLSRVAARSPPGGWPGDEARATDRPRLGGDARDRSRWPGSACSPVVLPIPGTRSVAPPRGEHGSRRSVSLDGRGPRASSRRRSGYRCRLTSASRSRP